MVTNHNISKKENIFVQSENKTKNYPKIHYDEYYI